MPYALKFNKNIAYKASQCTDVRDCELSLESLANYKQRCNDMGLFPPRSYYLRKFSLEKKMSKLLAKEFGHSNAK
jgi:hypothetical protein